MVRTELARQAQKRAEEKGKVGCSLLKLLDESETLQRSHRGSQVGLPHVGNETEKRGSS